MGRFAGATPGEFAADRKRGQLAVSVEGHTYELRPGDCLRYQLHGPSEFATTDQCGASYILFIV